MNSMKQTTIKNQTWWNRCSAHERGLMTLTVSRLFLFIALVVGIALITSAEAGDDVQIYKLNISANLEYWRRWSRPPPPPTAGTRSGPLPSENVPTSVGWVDNLSGNATCNLPGCVHAASAVLMKMDPEIDPCDNFYKFACGGFSKATRIPDDKVSVSMFGVEGDKLQDQLASSIEANIEPNESKPFRLVKTLYKTCKDTESIEKHGLKPLKDLLERLGGWPVINSGRWNGSDFDWQNVTYKFRETGLYMDYFINFNIGPDGKNSTTRVISLDAPSLGLSRKYLTKGFNNSHVQSYYKYMVDVAVVMGAEKDHAMKEMKKSLLFEIQLANYTLPAEELRNQTQMYNPMTLTQLDECYPSVPWGKYFRELLPPNIAVEKDEIVIVSVPSYISDFEKLISSTPKEIQANYVMWRFARECIPFLNEEIRKVQLVHSTSLSGRTERMPRTKECLGTVTRFLMPAVSAMYVRKYFDEEAKKNADEMAMDIKQQLTKSLEQAEWMDEQTRQSALEKAAAMSIYVGYPDELLDDDKLEKLYSNLNLSEGDYLESVLNVTRYANEKDFSELREPINKSHWENQAYSANVNAFYSRTQNRILIPAGILQGVFFSKDRPRYMNYGAIGSVIGHEMTHGFDDVGRQYNKDGNIVDFWTPSTEQKYLEKTKCIIQQAGNYTIEEVGRKLNGINTQGENIADNGGIKQAYRAYNDWVARNGPEQRLPALQNYTSNQMFWISSANVWCSKRRPKSLKRQITLDSHSPSEFRVIGSMSNMPEFAKDFNCPTGSRMNPENKCSLW